MHNTAAKKRAGQEDVDSAYLFDNFLQFPAFRSRPRPGNPFAVLRPVALAGTMRASSLMPNNAQKIVPNNSQSDMTNHTPGLAGLPVITRVSVGYRRL
jgi:hypothetical protein